jgi:hypothetical protein
MLNNVSVSWLLDISLIYFYQPHFLVFCNPTDLFTLSPKKSKPLRIKLVKDNIQPLLKNYI